MAPLQSSAFSALIESARKPDPLVLSQPRQGEPASFGRKGFDRLWDENSYLAQERNPAPAECNVLG